MIRHIGFPTKITQDTIGMIRRKNGVDETQAKANFFRSEDFPAKHSRPLYPESYLVGKGNKKKGNEENTILIEEETNEADQAHENAQRH
jgi:hypothetical protein